MNDDPRIGLYFAKLRCRRTTLSSSHPLPEDTKEIKQPTFFTPPGQSRHLRYLQQLLGVISELANITKFLSLSSVSCFGLKSDS